MAIARHYSQKDDRVWTASLTKRLNDRSRSAGNIRTSMAPNLSLVPYTTDGYTLEWPVQCARYRLSQRRLSRTWRTNETVTWLNVNLNLRDYHDLQENWALHSLRSGTSPRLGFLRRLVGRLRHLDQLTAFHLILRLSVGLGSSCSRLIVQRLLYERQCS